LAKFVGIIRFLRVGLYPARRIRLASEHYMGLPAAVSQGLQSDSEPQSSEVLPRLGAAAAQDRGAPCQKLKLARIVAEV
jgi:hypothetical protein